MYYITISTACITLFLCCNLVACQRSLLHWKRDLELRLDSYNNRRNVIHEIISSSVYPPRDAINGPALIKGQNVRFTDLIVPQGALILDGHVARPTVKFIVNKTQGYVDSKANELYSISSQLENIKRQINDPRQRYIFKGSPDSPQPQLNRTRMFGTWIFKDFIQANLIQSDSVTLKTINFTNVDQVLRETYMENPQFAPFDSNNRLFFEGRKTFWRTVFAKELRSGCCDRMKPLHTNRMMLKSVPQDVLAPILIQSDNMYRQQPVIIMNMTTKLLRNRALPQINYPGATPINNFSNPALENPVNLNNLINIRLPNDQPEIMKRLIFKDIVHIDDMFIASPDQRLVISVNPNVHFDLALENYLLRTYGRHNYSVYQQVPGTFVLNGDTQFLQDIEAITVNRVPNFRQFVTENIVRIDRPSIVRSQIQFNALPTIMNSLRHSMQHHNIVILRVGGRLFCDLINGMRFPDDMIFVYPHPAARPPNEWIQVRGKKYFATDLVMNDFVTVRQLVNGISMPGNVIPLHLNDFMGSVGYSNLAFLNGLTATHITIQSGLFDELRLREDVYDDAQHLIVRSVFARQPDQSQVIRAPLRIVNLRVFGPGPNRGLLNGVKPNDIIELQRQSSSVVGGKKTFLAPIEAIDCVFTDVNGLLNWTNHLIRIDRPNTVQTIHSKLVFAPQGSVYTDKLTIESIQNSRQQIDYLGNWRYSPELHILSQALIRAAANHTGGRYRVLNQVRLIPQDRSPARVNRITLDDVVTLDAPFRFADRFVLIGKVEIAGDLHANRITSNYPIDAMDLVQFNRYRVPTSGSGGPIQLNNLVLAEGNQASFLQTYLLNGTPWNTFVNTIMSLTRPQYVDTNLIFNNQVELNGLVKTAGSVNNLKNFKEFAGRLKKAGYSFENGLQCNTLVIR